MQQGNSVEAKIIDKKRMIPLSIAAMHVGPPLALLKRQSVPIAQSLSGGEQMFSHALSSGVPAAVLDMTADFTPLFVGMVLLMSFCVLAFAFAIGTHDTREAQRCTEQGVITPRELPKAA